MDYYVPKAVLESRSFTVEVRARGSDQLLGKVEAPVSNLRGTARIHLPELKKGDYEARFRLTS